ncbi:NlpC/P60 family protein [Caulobacter sp. CCG-8]|uniref:NlpC/P60 family protein n=1 Tax=Caulobacter sp. CCG-8 TaxID=3127958 RepID=UPI00307FB5AE
MTAGGGEMITCPHLAASPPVRPLRGRSALPPPGEDDREAVRRGQAFAVPDSVSQRALQEARRWLGTPYQHQASLRGVGCDCLGLVRGVWRALHGAEPEVPPPYRPDWAELGGRELLREALERRLIPLDPAAARPGDVLLFRMAPGAPAKHCAIRSADDRMIHAYWGRACVESWLGRWWRERLVAAFRYPES